ncbi:TetR/AcrR family transcriptional regulator [Nocardia sp. NPDC052278]|uniref:TetR/AcrR family transcriptional regulator n=1 Tax=unclassified Nocardia TaxID=2637762 RepID=UPI0036BF9363
MSAVDNVSMGASEPLRERLVGAGVDMLEEVGAAQLGLRAITRAAGVSHGAPRRHFPTHRALLAAIAARGFADLIERFAQAAAGTTTPREQLQVMAAEYVEFAGERPEMFTLMFRHDLLEGSGENLRAITLPLFERFAALVEAAAPNSDNPAINLWTNLHGIAALQANRSLRLVAPTADLRTLVAHTIQLHLT